MAQNFSEEELKKLHLYFSDEELEELLASERVDSRSDQIVRTSRIYVAAHYILLLVVSLLWAASNVTLTMGSTHWTAVSNLLLVLAIVATLAVITVNFLHKRYNNASFKQIERMAETDVRLKLLKKLHPGLYMLQSTTNLLNEEKEEAATRREFWASVAQNFVFLVLGFLISYALARLGWLR